MHRQAAEFYRDEAQELLRASIHFERAMNFDEAAFLATRDI